MEGATRPPHRFSRIGRHMRDAALFLALNIAALWLLQYFSQLVSLVVPEWLGIFGLFPLQIVIGWICAMLLYREDRFYLQWTRFALTGMAALVVSWLVMTALASIFGTMAINVMGHMLEWIWSLDLSDSFLVDLFLSVLLSFAFFGAVALFLLAIFASIFFLVSVAISYVLGGYFDSLYPPVRESNEGEVGDGMQDPFA